MATLLWPVSAAMYPVLFLVTASGFSRRPAALGLLLRILRPFGVSVPPKTSLQTPAKSAAQTSFGPLPESSPSALGSRAHSLGSAQCDPINNGKIQQQETRSCTRTKLPSSDSSAATRKFAPTTIAALPRSRWQRSPPI